MDQLSDFLHYFNLTQLVLLLLSAVAALLCITLHELSHGYVAYLLGDPTAKRQGRLTLNPIRHLDLLGFLMMITVHVGWAKPVPVDMRYFKQPKRDMAITALAGPGANFLTAWIVLLAASALYHFTPLWGSEKAALLLFYGILFLCYVAVLSLGLGLFNLIPIPPLDGAKILFSLLPDRAYFTVLRYEKYIMILMLILAWSGVFSKPLQFCMGHALQFFCFISGFPYAFVAYYFL